MRLFVAVELREPLVSGLERLLATLQRRAMELAPRSRIAWVAPESLHITLRFIGNVRSDRYEPIKTALEPPLNVEPFEVTAAGVGAFPSSGSPRVVWAGLEQGVARLRDVERGVSERLRRLGMPDETRVYTPHITLGRVKEPGGLRARSLLDGLDDQVVGAIRVEEITLFDSRLSSKGPTYVPLLRIGLRLEAGG